MTPDAARSSDDDGFRWFADEDTIGVGKVLEQAKLNVVYPGHPACPWIPEGTPDLVWIPQVAQAGWPILSHDKAQLRTRSEIAALRQHDAVAFFIVQGNLSSWEQVRLVARHWDTIKARAAAAINAPNRRPRRLFRVTRKGVQPV